VSRSALHRHKKHIPRVLAKVHQAEEVAAASSLRSQIEALMNEFRTIAARAQTDRQWSAAATALREVRACLELTAKLQPVVPHPASQDPERARARLREITERIRARTRLEQSQALATIPQHK
jgi:hypothetical protein